MKLDPKLAQSIVNRMMGQIPYNINMMDEKGVIIASGDEGRLGTLHLGAINAIKAGHALIMNHSYGEHGKPGVNMPVFFKKKIIGVIGITGAPDKVEPLASLLSTATELLISQTDTDEQKKQYESRLNRFLYQWIQANGPIENETTLLLEAEQLKINIQVPRRAIAIRASNFDFLQMDADDFQISTSLKTLIILTQHQSTISRITKQCQSRNLCLGIGETTVEIGHSVNQALRTMEISNRLSDTSLIEYQQVQFIDTLLARRLDIRETEKKMRDLDSSEMGSELLDTLAEYIRFNENMLQAADAMHIHRNTLNYRLHRLKEYTGLNPKQTQSLFQLYTAWLYLKFDIN